MFIKKLEIFKDYLYQLHIEFHLCDWWLGIAMLKIRPETEDYFGLITVIISIWLFLILTILK